MTPSRIICIDLFLKEHKEKLSKQTCGKKKFDIFSQINLTVIKMSKAKARAYLLLKL